jgi:hypothetical protein
MNESFGTTLTPKIFCLSLAAVGTVDATSSTNSSYSYPCVSVEPNSQIYFYQFTSPASTNVLWTTRFTIADATGKTVPPTLQETTAAGEIVRYGIGKLEDPSLADTPPARGGTNSTASASVNGTTTSTTFSTTAPTAPSGPSGLTTPTFTLTTDDSSSTDGSDNERQVASTTSKSTTPSSQSQKGEAVSYQRTASVGVLAAAILCGSLLV